jgi:hypothetical protein
MGENPGSGSGEKPGSGSSIVPAVDLSVAMSSRPGSGSAVPGAIDATSVRRTIGASPDRSGTAAQIANHNSLARRLATVDEIVEAIRSPLRTRPASSWATILSRVVVKASLPTDRARRSSSRSLLQGISETKNRRKRERNFDVTHLSRKT